MSSFNNIDEVEQYPICDETHVCCECKTKLFQYVSSIYMKNNSQVDSSDSILTLLLLLDACVAAQHFDQPTMDDRGTLLRQFIPSVHSILSNDSIKEVSNKIKREVKVDVTSLVMLQNDGRRVLNIPNAHHFLHDQLVSRISVSNIPKEQWAELIPFCISIMEKTGILDDSDNLVKSAVMTVIRGVLIGLLIQMIANPAYATFCIFVFDIVFALYLFTHEKDESKRKILLKYGPTGLNINDESTGCKCTML